MTQSTEKKKPQRECGPSMLALSCAARIGAALNVKRDKMKTNMKKRTGMGSTEGTRKQHSRIDAALTTKKARNFIISTLLHWRQRKR
jgi:hypothetical protein